MKRTNPQTSNDAYRSLRASEVRETYRQILESLDVLGKATFEDLAAHMKCSRDKVWKRLSELERLELIYKPGTKKTLKSGRQGYEWMKTHPKRTEAEGIHEFANSLIEIATKQSHVQKNLFE